MQETQEIQDQSLCWEAPLKEEMATPSSILAGTIPWTEAPLGSQTVGHDQVTEHTCTSVIYLSTHPPICLVLCFSPTFLCSLTRFAHTRLWGLTSTSSAAARRTGDAQEDRSSSSLSRSKDLEFGPRTQEGSFCLSSLTSTHIRAQVKGRVLLAF